RGRSCFRRGTIGRPKGLHYNYPVCTTTIQRHEHPADLKVCTTSERLGLPTCEARRIVDAPRSLVFCDLRIGTQRARAYGLSVNQPRADDRLRRRTVLHPFDQRGERVEGAHADALAAMEHARYHEQAIEVGGRRSASLQHALVVVHAHHWIERRIGPAEIADDFPAARLEPR